MNLITDRTAADVERYLTLRNKGFANLTATEKSEWLSNMKGAYNYTDLNRVEDAVQYVAGKLRERGQNVEIPDMHISKLIVYLLSHEKSCCDSKESSVSTY